MVGTSSVNEFLRAFSGYPLYIAVIIIALLFRVSLSRCFTALAYRIRKGDALRLGVLELGGRAGSELITSTDEAKKQPGLVDAVFGNPDRFQLLFKVAGPRLVKSTKAMEVPGGCLVLVSSEVQGFDGDWTVSEALTFVPGAVVVRDDGAADGFMLGPSR